jgi:pyridoxamine 5'-phosphate oxidase
VKAQRSSLHNAPVFAVCYSAAGCAPHDRIALSTTREQPEKKVTRSHPAGSLPEQLPSDPMHWADAWLKEAVAGAVQRNADAMTLATVDAAHRPSARIVLCKAFVPDPGFIVIHTNYRSRKGSDLAANPRVAAVFHWDKLGRQIRIEGIAVRSPEEESDAYFATRDRGSQLGAWGSDQSMPIGSREALVAQIGERAADLGVASDGEPIARAVAHAGKPSAIERPPHWGGYRIWASAIELWVEGRDRIHDRAAWRRELIRANEHSFSVTPWSGTRLQP